MNITNITIKRIVPKDGLIGFASFIIDDKLYVGNIGIFSRLNKSNFRLIFPEKKVNDKTLQIFYPITKDFYFELEKIVNDEIIKQSQSNGT